MKTVIALHNNDFLERLGLDSSQNGGSYLLFERLCIDNQRGFWEVHVEVRSPDAASCLPSLRESLDSKSGSDISRIVFRPRYPSDTSIAYYLGIHWPDIRFDISLRSESLLKFLEPIEWDVRDSLVEFKVCDGMSVRALRERGCTEIIRNCLKRDLGRECEVCFVSGDFTSYVNANLERRRQEFRDKERERVREAVEERKRIPYDNGRSKPQKPTQIKQIVTDRPLRATVTIQGKLFEHTRPGEKHPSTDRFLITDFSSTIECILRAANGNGGGSKPTMQTLDIHSGDWLAVTGILGESFREELELKVDRIEYMDNPVRRETSECHRIELHAHTKMSQMDGMADIADLIERAAYWQHPAIGITDHGNVHVFPEAARLGKEHGVKVLLGMEGYLANHESSYVADLATRKGKGKRALSKAELAEFKRNVFHVVLFAGNVRGLRNLYELVSASHTQYFYNKPLIPRNVLLEHREGLIIGSACERGEIFRLAFAEHTKRISPEEFSEKIAEAIQLYDYLEVQPIANNAFFIAKGLLDSEDDLRTINRRIRELGSLHDTMTVATGDVHLLDEHDALLRLILQAGQGYDKSSEEAERAAPLFFKTTDEMLEEFSYLGEAAAREVVIDNPARVAEMIEDVRPVPSGFHPPTIEGAAEDLKNICGTRCRELYGDNPHPLVEKRLGRELNDIVGNRFADLYILARKLVMKSHDDGYIVGSRGSVGSSFVAFLCGITEVNSLLPHYTCPECHYTEFVHFDDKGATRSQPLDAIQAEVGVDLPRRNCAKCSAEMSRRGFDIPFETFVGFEGNKTPDIDLNFASEYQSRAHRYIEELFGKEHVFRAGTLSTLQSKTAFGFVKKFLEETGEQWPNAQINRVVQGLTGIKRTTGQHPGGMIILPREKSIMEFCPVQFPANKAASGTQTTHFDFRAMKTQLLKLDILGHDDPTQIRLLCEFTGEDITQAPLDDKKTLAIFSGLRPLRVTERAVGTKVGTYGVPEFGTEFVRGMLVDTRPKTFADLIRISGLSHGTDVWLNNARDFIKARTATLKEAICTRDDIMHDLVAKGVEPFTAFKIMEKVRKGKGLKPEDVEVMKSHGVPDWYIDSCRKIKYMFPKAHAVAYVVNAFRIAYCKVHYPVAFYATYFTVMRRSLNAQVVAKGKQAIKEAIDNFLREGRRKLSANDLNALTVLEVALEMVERGVRMRPIDVYKSRATRCLVEDGEIIPPFTAFTGLGDAAAESIVAAREQGEFSSREDLQCRTLCNHTVVEEMARAGVLEDMPESDQMGLPGMDVF